MVEMCYLVEKATLVLRKYNTKLLPRQRIRIRRFVGAKVQTQRALPHKAASCGLAPRQTTLDSR